MEAIGSSLKRIAETPILNESIPKTKYKDKIFSRIERKGYSKFCYIAAISTLISGYLYTINPYIPIILCLTITILTTILGRNFIEIKEEEKENIKKKTMKQAIEDLKQGFTHIFKSKRLKALLLMIGLIWGLLSLFATYQVTLLKNMNVSAINIGIILAGLQILTGIASGFSVKYNKKFGNKSLKIIAYICTIGALVAGIATLLKVPMSIQLVIILITYIARMMSKGVYQIIKKVYMANFISNDILIKVYSLEGIASNLLRMGVGFIGTIILTYMNIEYAMIVAGMLFTGVVFIISMYMRSRVGLSPKKYEQTEHIKIDEGQ